MLSARVRGLDVLELALDGEDDSGGMFMFGSGGNVVFEVDGMGESIGGIRSLLAV